MSIHNEQEKNTAHAIDGQELKKIITEAEVDHAAFNERWKELAKYLAIRPSLDSAKQLSSDIINLDPANTAHLAANLIHSLIWSDNSFQLRSKNAALQETADYYQVVGRLINEKLLDPSNQFYLALQQAIKQWSTFGTATIGVFSNPDNQQIIFFSYHVLDHRLVSSHHAHGVIIRQEEKTKVILKHRDWDNYKKTILNTSDTNAASEEEVMWEDLKGTAIFTAVNNKQNGTPYGMGWGLRANKSIVVANALALLADDNSLRASQPPVLKLMPESVIAEGRAQTINVGPLAVNHASVVHGANFPPIVPFLNHDVPPSLFTLLAKRQEDIRQAYMIDQLQLESKTMTAAELATRDASRDAVLALIETSFYNELITPIIRFVYKIMQSNGELKEANATLAGGVANTKQLREFEVVYTSSITRERALIAYTRSINMIMPILSSNPESMQAINATDLLRDTLRDSGLKAQYLLTNAEVDAKIASKTPQE